MNSFGWWYRIYDVIVQTSHHVNGMPWRWSTWRVSGWLPTNWWNQLLRLTGTHEAGWYGATLGTDGLDEWRLELSSHFVGDHQSQEKIRAHIWRFPKMRGIPKSSKSFRLFDLKPMVTWVSSMTPSLDNTQGFIWRPLGGLKAATVTWPQWLAFCYHMKSYVAMIPWDHHVFSRNIANYSNLPGHTSHIQPHLSSSPVPGRSSRTEVGHGTSIVSSLHQISWWIFAADVRPRRRWRRCVISRIIMENIIWDVHYLWMCDIYYYIYILCIDRTYLHFYIGV